MFDLDKVGQSADPKPWPFKVQGEEFVFPPAATMDWHIAADLGEGQLRAALQRLLSPEDWARFDKLTISAEQLNDLFDAYGKSSGASRGESKASTGS